MQFVSKNISYETAIRSDMAKRKGLLNYFTPDQLVRMKILAENIYEPLVKHFGIPIYISSFFRSDEVNKLIGGVKDSQHLANNGAAMDLDTDMNFDITNQEVFDYIRKHLNFDQLIAEGLNEDGTLAWVHCSFISKDKNRHEILTMVIKNGKKYYEQYKK